MTKLIANWLVILMFGITLAMIVPGCKQDKDSQAVVFVHDEVGNPITSATVRMYSNSTSIDVSKQTLTDGSANFIFDNEAILFIDVSKDSYTAVNGEHVKLKPGEIVEKIIVLQ